MKIELTGKIIDLTAMKARLITDSKSYISSLEFMSQEMPGFLEDTVSRADQGLEGMIKLPGTGGVPKFVGNPPKWFEKMSGDNEFLWQLSRMNPWIPMLQAYILTGEKKYAEKVVSEFVSWDDEVLKTLNDGELLEKPQQFYSADHPLRLLECGIRLYKTWPYFIRYLADTEFLTEEILGRYVKSVHLQASIIFKYSPILWPKADHNHYLMENLGMLTTSLMFPELAESVTWKETAIRELNRASQVQLTPAGGQIEGCPSYHNGCMFWFGLLAVLANEYHFEISEEYIERYKKSLNYSLHCIRPTGKLVPFGDSHANEVAIRSLIFGYFVTGETYWLRHALQFYSKEAIVKKAREEIRFTNTPAKFIKMLRELEALNPSELLSTSFYNGDLGQIFVRTSWDPHSQFYAFSGRSPVQNGHAHIDVLTFEYVALGKNIIADPGIYTYRNIDARRYFKSSLAHSTVVLNNQDFFEYLNSFHFGPQKEGKLTNLIVGKEGVTGIGHNYAYDPTKINRALTLLADKCLVVMDKIENRQEKDLLTRTFHLDYKDVEIVGEELIALDEKVNTKLVNYPSQETTLKNGKLSDTNDLYRDSVEVHYHDESTTDFYVTVLAPFEAGEKAPDVKISVENQQVQVTLDGKIYLLETSNFNEIKVQIIQ